MIIEKILGYTIAELQEFINFAQEMDIEKLIKKIAILQNELASLTGKKCPYCDSPIKIIKQCSIHCLD